VEDGDSGGEDISGHEGGEGMDAVVKGTGDGEAEVTGVGEILDAWLHPRKPLSTSGRSRRVKKVCWDC
jgi:hypothetical protein